MGRWRRSFLGALIVGALVVVVMRAGELRNYAELVRQSEPGWIGLALLLQVSTYVSLALGWRRILNAGDGTSPPLSALLKIALSKLFADQVLPTAGIGGNVILVDQLVSAGASRGSAVGVLLISIRGYYAAYLVLALSCLFLLWLHGQASALLTGVVTTFVLVALAIPALALWLRARGSRPLPPVIERMRPIVQLLAAIAKAPAELIDDRKLLIGITFFNGLVFLADALTLYACLRGIGQHVAVSTALIAFVLSSIVVTLGPIPMGLGTFEASSTSVLHFLGVPIEAAFSSTVLFRLFVLWVPMGPGFVLSHRLMTTSKSPQHNEPVATAAAEEEAAEPSPADCAHIVSSAETRECAGEKSC